MALSVTDNTIQTKTSVVEVSLEKKYHLHPEKLSCLSAHLEELFSKVLGRGGRASLSPNSPTRSPPPLARSWSSWRTTAATSSQGTSSKTRVSCVRSCARSARNPPASPSPGAPSSPTWSSSSAKTSAPPESNSEAALPLRP